MKECELNGTVLSMENVQNLEVIKITISENSINLMGEKVYAFCNVTNRVSWSSDGQPFFHIREYE